MIPGSPTSLARHQPAAQQNEAPPFSLCLSPSRTNTISGCSCTVSRDINAPGSTLREDPLRETSGHNLREQGSKSSQEGRLLCVAVFSFIRGSLFYTCHNVRGAAIQRRQNERLWSGQRGQPDVL
ncbi:hypothetical protein XENORESO_012777 [Xenotaenia resolanae]|uniref:Uncharacterized protein n=1 Tax=Xenotaenia resolanae TaxID=208358 RepID=A0ABV0WTQ8_9TELE